MQSIKKVPILSFDLDGTLMTSGFGNKVWLEGLPQLYALTHEIPYSEAKKQLIGAYDALGNTRREWYDLSYWIDKLHLNGSVESLLKQFTIYIQAFPEVSGCIKRLSKQYRLIVSSAAMKPFILIELKTADLLDYFSSFFSATSDTQTVKKNPLFYKMIAEKLQCEPKEIIHVGDNHEFDYVTPIKAGLHAFYLDRSMSTKGEHVVSNLTEFEERIQEYPFD
ncbi:MAG: HAD family hydrolase [Candidatus Thermoplasmatota archaeon]|nr:HAD family hydrolase [Candidatus Thermoplasmatota archaeon]